MFFFSFITLQKFEPGYTAPPPKKNAHLVDNNNNNTAAIIRYSTNLK